MKLFSRYIKQEWRRIAVGILFCAVFAVTFSLYRLPIGAVAYPAMLCAATGLVLFVLDYRRVLEKHRKLQRICSAADAIAENFPRVDGIDDADYQQIITLLTTEQAEFRARASGQYEDMIAYYTVWAHQIKTPIASMRLTLQNEDSQLSRKLSADLFRIEQYVEMVLTFLRLDADSTDYVIQEYELDSILRQSVKKFAGEFIGRKLRLVYEPVNVSVITDGKWLAFVVEQVLSNALKYTPDGSITISLEEPKTLCIRDTGMGIAPEDLPRIFENGYTGYHGRADKKASGIGLYLCKRICRNLGYGITAESVPGEGTVIKIDLRQQETHFE